MIYRAVPCAVRLSKLCYYFDHQILVSFISACHFFLFSINSVINILLQLGLFIIGYGDVGPGTIVGSAVFNILVALALVSLFAGQVSHRMLFLFL